jgi:hypothetical protein
MLAPVRSGRQRTLGKRGRGEVFRLSGGDVWLLEGL